MTKRGRSGDTRITNRPVMSSINRIAYHSMRSSAPTGRRQLNCQLWQPSHDLAGAHVQFDDAQNQIENIPRIIVFACPVVRVVHDATRFIGADLILIDEPAQCTTAIDDVFDLQNAFYKLSWR